MSNEELLQDLKKEVFGNGKLGLKEETTIIKEQMKDAVEKLGDLSEETEWIKRTQLTMQSDMQWIKKIGGLVFGMVATILAGMIGAGIIAAIRHF